MRRPNCKFSFGCNFFLRHRRLGTWSWPKLLWTQALFLCFDHSLFHQELRQYSKSARARRRQWSCAELASFHRQLPDLQPAVSGVFVCSTKTCCANRRGLIRDGVISPILLRSESRSSGPFFFCRSRRRCRNRGFTPPRSRRNFLTKLTTTSPCFYFRRSFEECLRVVLH